MNKNFPKMILRACLVLFLFSSTDAYFVNEEECLNYTVYPVQYELTIIPYIYKDRRFYYNCEITITVIANAPDVQQIELDAKDLELNGDIKVLDGEKDIINVYRPYEYNNTTGKLYIFLRESLKQHSVAKTQYKINISFRKHVSYDSTGVFIVPYEDGGTKYMYTTRLSPNKAKYFFPCFDNPLFEAVFKFRVYVPPAEIGVQHTNTSLVIAQEQRRHNLKDKYVIIDYVPSSQVRLYQVGFHHSQFGHRQVYAKNTKDTLVIWAPAHKLHYYDFILSFGERILNLIHEYASVNRPLLYGPINVIAVPANLDGYEVGSWNILTNGENRLAHVHQYTSIKQEERMTFELTQQLCRIWLGNPGELRELQQTRWKEEWLKEGMATYFAYYLLTQYHHGEQTITYNWPIGNYGLQMRHKAMAEDWHHSTPALANFNSTLAVDIPLKYKELVNMKTASILWMIENWLGSDKFHMALVKYINKRRGKYIFLEDFMTQLDLDTKECLNQFFNGSTASKVLNSWFHQLGYPVIDVNVLRDQTPNAIQLKQHKFSFNHERRGDSNYLIPVSYMVQNNQNCFNCYQPRFTIDRTYTFKENLNDGWIILNRNASGYYRVNYDPITWKLIAKTLNEDPLSIDEQNRAQIVNDVFALYAAGEMNHRLAVEILDYLNDELSPIVWDSVITGFELLKTDGASCGMTKFLYEDWQEFMRNKVGAVYSQLFTNKQQQPQHRMYRSNIVGFACAIKYQACVNDLRHMYEDSMGGFDPDTREAYYRMLYEEGPIFGGKGFNAFEVEDKMVAEHKVRKEKQFLYRIPMGNLIMDRLVMPSSSAPMITPLIDDSKISKQTITPEEQTGRGSVPHMVSTLILSLCVIVYVTIR